MIRIRRLRLVGTSRNYEVSFLDLNGSVRPLSIIAGEISTGKSSVLEFIDYDLGDSAHPKHVEIRRQVRTALLEVDLSGETYVIERPVFGDEQTVWVHRCDLDGLDEPHETKPTVLSPVGDLNSLSTFLLEHIGLDRIRLREAPTQQASRTDPLSFRDVMWLCFLPNRRMDNRQLLQEQHYMRELKLRQVIEVLFGVHDQQLAALGERLSALEEERRDQEREIESLQTFLREDEVPDRLTLEGQIVEVDRREAELRERLSSISARMRAETDFGEQLRASYAELRRESDVRAARVRDRETLLRRLLPLRGQYAEDETKLVFFAEAKRLFDPVRVTTCPSCLQELPQPASIEADQTCSLCRQEVRGGEDESMDVDAERAALRLRLRAIDAYIDEVEAELATARADQRRSAEREAAAQAQLDSDLAAKAGALRRRARPAHHPARDGRGGTARRGAPGALARRPGSAATAGGAALRAHHAAAGRDQGTASEPTEPRLGCRRSLEALRRDPRGLRLSQASRPGRAVSHRALRPVRARHALQRHRFDGSAHAHRAGVAALDLRDGRRAGRSASGLPDDRQSPEEPGRRCVGVRWRGPG